MPNTFQTQFTLSCLQTFRIVALFTVLVFGGNTTAEAQSDDGQKKAALDQALNAGVISREEYDSKIARLEGRSIDPAKKAALDNALKTGVITREEYNTKLQALQATISTNADGKKPASTTAPDSVGNGKKTVAVVDNFFNMPAFKVGVPSDWTVEGAVLRSDCGDGIPFLVFRAYSPDKLSGIQCLPQADWYSASDARAYKFAGVSPCNLHAPARAAEVATKIATDLRSGANVIEMPPLTSLQAENFRKASEQGHAQLEQMNRQFPPNFQSTWNLDMQRVKIGYNFEGHPVEEMLTVILTTWGNPVSVAGTGPGGIIQPGTARLTHTTVKVTAIRAPANKLEATITRLERESSVDMIPEWNDAEIAFIKRQGAQALAIQQKNQEILKNQAGQFAKNMQTSNERYHAWQQQRRVANEEKFAQDMQRKDSQAHNFLDYVNDQTYYVNPSTGQTITIKNELGVSGYVGQNPSGGWTQLVPISH